ncbi:MAG: ATP-binding protein [Bacteroidales bacterium]|nr:ATP-binding protein [Bacteroidales bacterium]
MAEEIIDIVGKDLLEQLMFSLYPDAETIYREYLQNACDSINEAAELGILPEKKDGHVTINIDKFHHTITIEDNGTGIKADEAEMTLKYIARSKKKKESSAGFYGIGRLVGGGYCKQLSFITSAEGENIASEMIFDMDKIRYILEDDEDNSSASEVIHKVTSFRNDIAEEPQKHYFKVILKDILPDYHDVLLDEEKIYSYLMQVAPIPYDATFFNNLIKPNITKDDNKYLDYYNKLNAVKVSINNIVGIEKPYETKFKGTEHEYTDEDGSVRKDNAPINEIRFFSIADPDPKLGDLAWGWYAYTPAGTQIKETDPYTNENVLTRSIRLRCHNIQVGDENVLNKYFKQARSHTYFNGEVFIINQDIKPTADRSDIAPTSVAKRFQERLGEFFRNELEKLYQEANKANKQLENIRKADEEIRKIEESTELPSESKATELAKQQEEKQKAQEKLNKIIAKSDDERQYQSMRTLAENFKKQLDDYQNNPTAAPVSSSVTPPPTPPKTIEEKINELAEKYNDKEVSMVRKIFNIIDTRYLRKYEALVRNIKNSVLNDLKK